MHNQQPHVSVPLSCLSTVFPLKQAAICFGTLMLATHLTASSVVCVCDKTLKTCGHCDIHHSYTSSFPDRSSRTPAPFPPSPLCPHVTHTLFEPNTLNTHVRSWVCAWWLSILGPMVICALFIMVELGQVTYHSTAGTSATKQYIYLHRYQKYTCLVIPNGSSILSWEHYTIHIPVVVMETLYHTPYQLLSWKHYTIECTFR